MANGAAMAVVLSVVLTVSGIDPARAQAQAAPNAAPAAPSGPAGPTVQQVPRTADPIVPPLKRTMPKAGPIPAAVKSAVAPAAAKRCATGKSWNDAGRKCVPAPEKARAPRVKRGKGR